MITTRARQRPGGAQTSASRTRGPARTCRWSRAATASTVVVPATTAAIITIPAAANGTYLIQQPTAPTSALPKAPLSGTPRHGGPPPRRHQREDRPRRPRLRAARPVPDADADAAVRLGPEHRRHDPRLVELRPRRPLGRRRRDLPRDRPDRQLSASITGTRYLRTPATTLGYLREATWAAEIKINAGTTYRRIWDWKTASGGDGVGFLIDLTPTGPVRVITSGSRRHHQRDPADRALHQPGHHDRPRRRDQRLRRRHARSAAARTGPRRSTAARRPSCGSAPTRAAASASAPSSTARRCSPRR